ncbi:polymerase [uncultured Limosilactobacillus sp.]|uniref:polymerase n=1 Tax=uncultured Limosilactobacillus sp. TaxID=2837629 RepID=UPI0025D0C2D7|nr:polymerase [uncultured Limosilactobacillus sp.]
MQNPKMSMHNSPISGIKIYFLAFTIYFFPTFLIQTTFSTDANSHFLRLISYLSIPLLLYKIFVIDRWRKRELIAIILIMLASIITWRTAHISDYLFLFPLIFGAKNIYFKDIVKWYLYFNTVFMLSIMGISLLKIIPNLIYYSDHRPTRYALGMVFPSNIAAFFLFMALAYCYVRFNRLNLWDYLGIFIIGCVGMKLTNTRLDFLATVLIIPIMIIAQRAYRGKTLSRYLGSFFWMAIPVTAWVVIVGSYFYDKQNYFLKKLNDLSSGRLILGHDAFQRYKPNLFGRSITEYSYAGVKGHKYASEVGSISHNYFYIDSSYLRMLLLWGTISFIIIILCLTAIALKSTIQRTYVLSAIILIISLSLMFEPHVIQLIYNPFLLSLFSIDNYVIKKEPYEWLINLN